MIATPFKSFGAASASAVVNNSAALALGFYSAGTFQDR